jgi:hypothetical protein
MQVAAVLRAFAGCAVALALPACHGVSSVPSAQFDSGAAKSSTRGTASSGCNGDPCLYVVDRGVGGGGKAPRLAVFDASASGNVAPSRLVIGNRAHLDVSLGVAVDAAGNTYVTSAEGPLEAQGFVVYSAGATGNARPIRTINGPHTGLTEPDSVAVDTDGTTYVANYFGGPFGSGSVTVYSASADGDASPLRTILRPKRRDGVFYPVGLALDGYGDLYVLAQSEKLGDEVLVYGPAANGRERAMRRLLVDMHSNALALDVAGALYVLGTNYTSGADEVKVFAPGASDKAPPIRVISGSNVPFFFPTGVGVDSDGDVFVTNKALPGHGRRGSVMVFAPGANGNVKPSRIIRGPLTDLESPMAITVR